MLSLTDTLALLFISMIILAVSLYLPGHISTMVRRGWFYWAGDETVGRNAGVDVGAGAGAAAGARAGYMNSGQKIGGAGGRMDGQDVVNRLGTL